MAKPALVVFDMAGTTIEDSGQVPEAFTYVLGTHGIAISEAELNALRGASKRDAIRHFVARSGQGDVEARTDTVFAGFRDRLSKLFHTGGVKPVAGAAKTFAWLRARGIRVALNTGFDRTIANLIIESVGWQAAVDAVVCGDDVASGRPSPDLIFKAMEQTGVADARSVMAVGDTVLDLRAGRNAGAGWVVGVLSGAHGRAQLEAEPHDALIGSVAELPALLEVHTTA
ncbi:MAG: phosphonatase-like hydrolase [Betaproteobacteria bacterium]